MIKRYKILAEDNGRSPAVVGSESVFLADPEDGTLPNQQIIVTITGSEPNWGPASGPSFARFEGFIKEPDGTARTVLGHHVIGPTAATYIGRLEVHYEDD